LWEALAQSLFLAVPVLVAGIGQGLCIRHHLLMFLYRPLDLGLTWKQKPLFGANKTWRGLVLSVTGCVLGAQIQAAIQARSWLPEWIYLVDYQTSGVWVGLLTGLGMTLGELPNSLVKRRLGIAPGQKARGSLAVVFFLWDQVDLAVGIWILLWPLLRPSWALVGCSFLLTLFLHMAVSWTGFVLRMRATPF